MSKTNGSHRDGTSDATERDDLTPDQRSALVKAVDGIIAIENQINALSDAKKPFHKMAKDAGLDRRIVRRVVAWQLYRNKEGASEADHLFHRYRDAYQAQKSEHAMTLRHRAITDTDAA